MLGDSTNNKSGVRADFVGKPRPPVDAAKIKGALKPARRELMRALTSTPLKKSDTKRDAIIGGSAAAGAGIGQGVYQQAGYGTKHYVDRHTRKGHPGVTNAQVNRQDKALKPLKSKFGMHNPHGSPLRNNKGYHRAYPTSLPYGRAIKTLGYTHEGKLGMATGAAATALGAVGAGTAAYKLSGRKKVSKLLSPDQVRRRKKFGADLGLASAALGVGALGSKGAEGVLRAKGMVKPAAKLASHTNTALIGATGVGSVGAFNSAALSRNDANKIKAKQLSVPKPKKPNTTSGVTKALYTTEQKLQGATDLGRLPKRKKAPPPPMVRASVKGALRDVQSGRQPDMSSFSGNVHGEKAVVALDRKLNIGKGAVAGVKQGARLAGLAGDVRHTARAGSATQVAGRKAGAMAHDFRAGFARKVPSNADIAAGKTTHHGNAVYPGMHTAGTWTRRVGVPAVVLGGGYKGGKAIGQRKQRKRMMAKGADMQGQLVPVSKAMTGYDSEESRHNRNQRYVGASYAGAGAAGVLAAHQASKVRGGIKPLKTGVRIGKPALKSGGRALAAAGAAGALVATGHKIAQKSERRGGWY